MDKQLSGEGTPTARTQGQGLRLAREEQGWSKAQLADKIGVATKTVKRWEGNLTSPHPYAAHKLCTVLQKSKEELALGKLTAERATVPEETGRPPKVRPLKLSRPVVILAALCALVIGSL